MRQKELGIWQRFLWEDEHEQVRDFALGLVEMGLRRGDRVAILGDNDRQYLWGAYGAMAAGGVVVGIFADSTPPEVEYIVGHSDAVFVMAGDQEQCDKLLKIRESVPLVRQVIYWEDRGMWGYENSWLTNFGSVQDLGRRAHAADPECFDRTLAEGRKDEPAMFCYTPGTTGQPKGVILSHQNFVLCIHAFAEVDPRYDTDNQMSFLPLALIALGLVLIFKATCIFNFAQGQILPLGALFT